MGRKEKERLIRYYLDGIVIEDTIFRVRHPVILKYNLQTLKLV